MPERKKKDQGWCTEKFALFFYRRGKGKKKKGRAKTKKKSIQSPRAPMIGELREERKGGFASPKSKT